MKTIKENWESYEASVVPEDASPYQREETKRAFYGGAASMFHMLLASDLDNKAASAAHLNALDQELNEFVEGVLADAAS